MLRIKRVFAIGLSLLAAGSAAADPGPGLRWSDMAWGGRGAQPRGAVSYYSRPHYYSSSYQPTAPYRPAPVTAYYPAPVAPVVVPAPVVPSPAAVVAAQLPCR